MRSEFTLRVFIFLALLCATCVGQGRGSVHGTVFREAAMGLTYEFPQKFSPKVESEIPSRDQTGREHMILALWDTPARSGQPRMSFLYDTKQRSSDGTHDTITLAYIGEVKGMWLGAKGAKLLVQLRFLSQAMTIGGWICPLRIKCRATTQSL